MVNAIFSRCHILTSDVQISRTGKFFGNNTKLCNQLLTVAADGMVLFWDLRGSDPKLEVNERERLPFRQLDLNWSPLLRVCPLRSFFFFFFLFQLFVYVYIRYF